MKTPSLRTFEAWSKKNGWAALARGHDAAVAARAGEQIIEAQTKSAVRCSEVYRIVSEISAQKLLSRLQKLEPSELTVADLRALAEISERTGKMADLLHGRTTEPQDRVTREKLDALFEEMEEEVAARLSGIRADKVH